MNTRENRFGVSERSQAILATLGWTPEREVDISPYVECLKTYFGGFLPDALAVLRCFGDLRVPASLVTEPPEGVEARIKYYAETGRTPPPEQSIDPFYDLVFNPYEAEPDDMEYWKTTLGLTMTPVASHQADVIAFGSDGLYYLLGMDRCLYRYDNTIGSVIEAYLFPAWDRDAHRIVATQPPFEWPADWPEA